MPSSQLSPATRVFPQSALSAFTRCKCGNFGIQPHGGLNHHWRFAEFQCTLHNISELKPEKLRQTISQLMEEDGSTELCRSARLEAPDEQASIHCHLLEYPFPDSGRGTHLYEALSYVWGGDDKSHFIHTEARDLHVTRNLHAALLRLRDSFLPRVLWIDAICINQADTDEKESQVGIMAKIYARANRVLVWLEDARINASIAGRVSVNDSNQALEEISQVAENRFKGISDKLANPQIILNLLHQPWFSRIWVLQEVAAARNILLLSRCTELDGYAFASTLKDFDLLSTTPEMQNRIRSVAYLMSGAPFRPKYALSQRRQFSLAIHTLGELIEMYHNHNATEPVDKVYALLGMSSDMHLPSQWPDYSISWSELFYQLIRFFVGEHATIETWNESQVAVVHSRAAVLGYVKSVSTDGPWDDIQTLDLDLPDTVGFLTRWTRCWTVKTSVNLIRNGDIVCLLPGASKPMIVRPYKDYCAIIAITINPPKTIDWTMCLNRIKTFQINLLLLWDWESGSRDLEKAHQLDYLTQSKVAKLIAPRESLEMREYNIGLLFAVVKQYDQAFARCRPALQGAEILAERNRLRLLAAFDKIASLNTSKERAHRPEIQLSLESVFISLSLWKDNIEIPEDSINWAVEWLSGEVVAVMLNLRKDPLRISEEVMQVAARNFYFAEGVVSVLVDRLKDDINFMQEAMGRVENDRHKPPEGMALTLGRGGDNIPITQDVYMQLESDMYTGRKVMAMLIERRARQSLRVGLPMSEADATLSRLLPNQEAVELPIAEEVLLAVVRNCNSGKEVMNNLLRRHGHNNMQITAKVLEAAAGNYMDGPTIMRLLLDKPGTTSLVNKDVLMATARNSNTGQEILELLVQLIGNDIIVTEEMVFAAVNSCFSHPGLISKLLQLCGDNIAATERIMNAVVRKEYRAGELTLLFVQHQRAATQASITEQTFEIAATSGNRDALDILYKYAAQSPARRNWHDVADLFIAARQGDVESLKGAIGAGTNPDTRNWKGETPLCIAVRYEKVEVARFLAGREDVDVNSRSNGGWSVLYVAVAYRNLDILTLLLDAGANPDDVNPNGQSVADIEREIGGWNGIYMLEMARRILSSLSE